MKDGIQKENTAYISFGVFRKKTDRIYGKLIGNIFSKFVFDNESYDTLKEYSGKERVVYASLQNSMTSLIIFNNLLKKNKLPVPHLAIWFRAYWLQRVGCFFVRIGSEIVALFSNKKCRKMTEEEGIERMISQGKNLCVSILSPKLFMQRYVEIKMDVIEDLVETQMKTDAPIYFVPMLHFWNRNPERDSIIAPLESTGNKGFLSALIITLKSMTPGFIRICAPVNLKKAIAESKSKDIKVITSKIRTHIYEIYDKEKRTILGPVVKNRSELMEMVLYHKNVLNEIKKQSELQHIPEHKLRKQAYKYFNEMASDFSIVIVKLFQAVLTPIFKRIFDGIYTHNEDFKKLREAALKGPIVFVPAHKSHVDYLILSMTLYQNMLMPPHIHAGANLNFFPIGYFFRRAGAYFVRRSFKGLEIYAIVFKQIACLARTGANESSRFREADVHATGNRCGRQKSGAGCGGMVPHRGDRYGRSNPGVGV